MNQSPAISFAVNVNCEILKNKDMGSLHCGSSCIHQNQNPMEDTMSTLLLICNSGNLYKQANETYQCKIT